MRIGSLFSSILLLLLMMMMMLMLLYRVALPSHSAATVPAAFYNKNTVMAGVY